MKFETTPDEITSQIKELCKTISESIPVYIPVQPAPDSTANNCFPNVEAFVRTHGGTSVLGWAIWQRANILIEAEAHAVWKSSRGELIDITPHSHQESRILFLEDPVLKYEGNHIPNIRVPLTTSPLVAEFIQLFDERDRIAAETPGNTYSLSPEMFYRMLEIEDIFYTRAGRNDPCPCGSGIKYKRCCGLFE